jgi:hypothetical protein
MNEGKATSGRAKSPRRWIRSFGVLGAGLVAGGILAGSHLAGAATNTAASKGATAATASSSNSSSSRATMPDPATVNHGPGETLLTGTTASQVTAAAKAAVPGATIIRVETDSDGAAYEAHMKKADGSFVTVKLDKSFKVTSTVAGFGGPGPRGASGTTP